jgi:hypothetical protein
VPARSYAARDTKGQSIGAFFQALLVARPPAPTPSPESDHAATNSGPHENEKRESKAAPVSFDDFFGSAAKGSDSLTGGGSEQGKDDLDQFHSWLQNLKR